MMSIFVVLFVLTAHFISDFIMQDATWATNKNHSLSALLKHTSIYSLSMGAIFSVITNLTLIQCLSFTIITFLLHTLTDYITSKIITKKFNKKQYGTSIPNRGVFTIIGLDQLLHYMQLFFTLYVALKYF